MREQQGTREAARRVRRWATIAAAVTVMWAWCAATAPASVISIGSVLPEKFEATEFKRVQTFFNTALPESGATLSSPVNGVVVRWRLQGASGGPFYLRVLRPNGKGGYEAVGTSQGASPTGEGLQTFNTNLKIQAGDLIGVDPTNVTDKIGVAEASGAGFASIFPTPFDGSVVPPSESFDGKEIELSAEIQPQPEISLVSPSFGPIGGGTVVKITGKNFSNASEVRFGSVAAGFNVGSDTEITATAPKGELPGHVDITVTSFAGTNPDTAADDYTYLACVVPRVENRTLRVAKTLLRRSGCKLGQVKKVDAPNPKKAGKVLKQQPRPGKVLAPGSKVRVQLGLKPGS